MPWPLPSKAVWLGMSWPSKTACFLHYFCERASLFCMVLCHVCKCIHCPKLQKHSWQDTVNISANGVNICLPMKSTYSFLQCLFGSIHFSSLFFVLLFAIKVYLFQPKFVKNHVFQGWCPSHSQLVPLGKIWWADNYPPLKRQQKYIWFCMSLTLLFDSISSYLLRPWNLPKRQKSAGSQRVKVLSNHTL